MLFQHPDHPGRRVRLAYCLNLHAAADLATMLEGIRSVTLPLRDRLAPAGRFGVGMYLEAALAKHLNTKEGAAQLDELKRFVDAERLDPFTYNAFPYGGFHADGLKADVFKPTWAERARLAFTLDVANVAAELVDVCGPRPANAHVSISTHPGMFGEWVQDEHDLAACGEGLARAADGLAQIEERAGLAMVLAVEAEPRASCGDTRELGRFLVRTRESAAAFLAEVEGYPEGFARGLLRRHLGTCLDCCHAAVEFEEPDAAFAAATAGDGPIGKIQFSSALSLAAPDTHPDSVAALLAMAEPRYLHQVTGRSEAGLHRATDLPELAQQWGSADPAARAPWAACDEWRCHFHVPVDLSEVPGGLTTTRPHADRLLATALARPDRWGTEELHLEIETYTWDILPGPARGAGDLVDGLEREYAHVMQRLESAGWTRA